MRRASPEARGIKTHRRGEKRKLPVWGWGEGGCSNCKPLNARSCPRSEAGPAGSRRRTQQRSRCALARLTALARGCQGQCLRLPASPGVTHFLLENALEDGTDPLSLQGAPCPNHLQRGWNHRGHTHVVSQLSHRPPLGEPQPFVLTTPCSPRREGGWA